jgi:hypothetical protein
MNEELLNAIKHRSELDKRSSSPFPPASPREIDDAERRLGLRIPDTLKIIYLRLGNGGMGPAGGRIIGLESGYSSDIGTLVDAYQDVQKGATYFGREWPSGLLPFCEWGCAIFSCVDCNDSHSRVYLSKSCEPHAQSYNLNEFVQFWANGVCILDLDPRPRVHKEMTNPFTGQKTLIVGRKRNRPDPPPRTDHS